MEDWRRNPGESRNPHRYQPFSKPFKGSHYRKPYQTDFVDAEIPSWVHSVPFWEKKFIINVGKMPWGRFMHCQKVLDRDGAVFQWDDSAGREAFQNAKSRYWAEMKGLYCGIPLSDPCMYIQEIDWNARTDPKLYQELEIWPVEDENDASVDSVWNLDQPIVPTGWGDEDANWKGDDNKAGNKDNPWTSSPNRWDGVGWDSNYLSSLMKPILPTGCVDGADGSSQADKSKWCNSSLQNDDNQNINEINHWEDKCAGWQGVEPWGQSSTMKNTPSSTWEEGRGGWQGAVPWGQSSGMKNTTTGTENPNYFRNNANWESGNEKWKKRESEDHHLSRYKTTRYHSNDYQPNFGWKNDRGKKRVCFADEQYPMDPGAPPHQCNSFQNCGSTNQHRPRGWVKNVSHHMNY